MGRAIAQMLRNGLLPVVAACLLATGCHDGGPHTDAAQGAAERPVRGGTARLSTAQEPPTLNHWLATGGMAITELLTDPLRSPWVQLDEHGAWQPVLLTEVPTAANGGIRARPDGSMTIALSIRPEARWSDGRPIGCRDLHFTWQTVMDDRWQIGTRIGWEFVTAVDCFGEKRARITLDRPYAPYLQHLLATTPLPEHELAGRDFDTAWSNRITVSSGPFVFRHWRRGVELVLDRNPNWWGDPSGERPYLDRIVWRFVPDAGTMKLDLRMGATDMIGLPPDTNLRSELESMRDVTFSIMPGAGWEQLSFNTARAPLDDVRVRQAVAHAIDRAALTDVILRRQVSPLQSTLLTTQKPWHTPVFDRYVPDRGAVAKLMGDAGWALDDGGRWRKHGRTARLELTAGTGNPIRIKAVQLIQQELLAAGFDVRIATYRTEVYFASVVAPGRYHLGVYAFGSGPDPSQARLFACSEIPQRPHWRGKNNFRYCDARTNELTLLADQELDPARRAALLAELQERLALHLPTLPLFETPDTLAWNERLHGVRPNPLGGHTWNTEHWWVTP